MNLVVYTLPYPVSNEAQKINNLFDEGLEELHIRKCRFSLKQTEDFLKRINPKYLSKVVLHMHYNLALKYKLKGIHVNKSFFKGLLGFYRKFVLDNNLKTYTTVKSCNEIEKLDYPFSHILMGPLFKHYSSNHSMQNFNAFELNKTLKNTDKSIFALGGIELKNTELIKQFKFDAFVIQSSIWKSDDYMNAFNAFVLQKADNKGSKSLGLRVS